MTADDQPYTVALNIDAPPSPDYVLELAETVDQGLRVLAHQTRDREALEFPAEGDRLLRYLESAAERLPQLVTQVAMWYVTEAAGGRLEVVSGDRAGAPWLAAAAITTGANRVRAAAEELRKALHAMTEVTANLAAAGGEGEDDSDE